MGKRCSSEKAWKGETQLPRRETTNGLVSRKLPKEKAVSIIEDVRKKTVNNILTAIEESKKKPFACLLTALGIPLLSSVKAKKLTNFYPDLTSLLRGIENNE